MADHCADCRFFRRAWTRADHGNCRRTPPVVVGLGQSLFPNVGAEEWCGEFAPRPCGAEFTSNVGANGNVYVEPFTYVCDLRIGHDGRHSCADFRVGTNMNKYKAVSR